MVAQIAQELIRMLTSNYQIPIHELVIEAVLKVPPIPYETPHSHFHTLRLMNFLVFFSFQFFF